METQDELSLQRTRLANYRTMLAFCSASLTMLAAAVTLWRLVPDEKVLLPVLLLFVTAVFVFLAGLKIYFDTKKIMRRMHGDPERRG